VGTVDVDTPVTLFVGENGSGNSTVLEGVAAAADLPSVGSDTVDRDATLASQRELGWTFQLAWTHRARRVFFLGAEGFFGFARSLAKLRNDLIGRFDPIDDEYRDRSTWARGLAQAPTVAFLDDMERWYGV
jgi:predicted ATPase